MHYVDSPRAQLREDTDMSPTLKRRVIITLFIVITPIAAWAMVSIAEMLTRGSDDPESTQSQAPLQGVRSYGTDTAPRQHLPISICDKYEEEGMHFVTDGSGAWYRLSRPLVVIDGVGVPTKVAYESIRPGFPHEAWAEESQGEIIVGGFETPRDSVGMAQCGPPENWLSPTPTR